jgi:hypothetical protein
MTNYGRGRSTVGKIHARDPELRGSALCCISADARIVDPESPHGKGLVDCKRCLKILAKREAGR